MTDEGAGTPTRVQPGAAWIGAGIPVTIVGVMVLLASAYAGLLHAGEGSWSNPSPALAWVGWLLVLLGSCLLGLGAFYLAQHADRAAG